MNFAFDELILVDLDSRLRALLCRASAGLLGVGRNRVHLGLGLVANHIEDLGANLGADATADAKIGVYMRFHR